MENIFAGTPRSPGWDNVRNTWIVNNNFCRCCGSRFNLEVHHIRPYHLWPEFELESTNLITLCREHHLEFGHLNSWYSYNLDIVAMADDFLHRLRTRPSGRPEETKLLF